MPTNNYKKNNTYTFFILSVVNFFYLLFILNYINNIYRTYIVFSRVVFRSHSCRITYINNMLSKRYHIRCRLLFIHYYTDTYTHVKSVFCYNNYIGITRIYFIVYRRTISPILCLYFVGVHK